MSRVAGRTDDMLIIRGVNVFPSQIEELIFETEGAGSQYQVVIDRKGALDEVTVLVEAAGAASAGPDRRGIAPEETIRKRLAHELGIAVEVKRVEGMSLARSDSGKAIRVVDHRKL
jgi:phenylacetate-CoA ligase